MQDELTKLTFKYLDEGMGVDEAIERAKSELRPTPQKISGIELASILASLTALFFIVLDIFKLDWGWRDRD